MEGNRRRGRPAATWFQDLKEWTKLDIAAALITTGERPGKMAKITGERREGEREGERERISLSDYTVQLGNYCHVKGSVFYVSFIPELFD